MKNVFLDAFLKVLHEFATDDIFVATSHQGVLHGVQYCKQPTENSAGAARSDRFALQQGNGVLRAGC